ncbi:Ldh family oxidoreductase [Rhizohabitans arisaemae]|uniref:Ldh family oxidoreductase n=1 Tax=Rhizohabitans arisaemae TaxID=2720610 RepID=UPI0024B0EF25|nr:Ldh family oxidoreductase [Rhizohabitans arisaemae]
MVTAGQARALLERVLAPYPDDRTQVAAALVEAHLRGRPEFGLPLLDRELSGPGHPCAPVTAGGEGAVRTIDAAGVPGPVAMAAAVRHAGAVARDLGLGLCAARSVTGTGRLAPYVAAQATRGRVALLFAHAPRVVAPHGGRTPVLGTDPVAYALPRAGGVLAADFTTAAITQADLAAHRAKGEELPPATAIDDAGRAVVDPGSVHALLPAGGLLGTLVGLFVEAVAGALLDQRDNPRGRGVVALVLDPASLGADQGLAVRVEALCAELTAAGGRAPGAAVPDEGLVEVDDAVWHRLEDRLRAGS